MGGAHSCRIANDYSKKIWVKYDVEKKYVQMEDYTVDGQVGVAGVELSAGVSTRKMYKWNEIQAKFTPVIPRNFLEPKIDFKGENVVFVTIIADDGEIICNSLSTDDKRLVVTKDAKLRKADKTQPFKLHKKYDEIDTSMSPESLRRMQEARDNQAGKPNENSFQKVDSKSKRRKMQSSTTLAECKEKATSEVSPTLVLSSMSSMQSEDSKQQDDIGVMENNEDPTDTAVSKNNNDTTDTGVVESHKDTTEAVGIENIEDTTDSGVIENNEDIADTGVIENNENTSDSGVMEINEDTTDTGVMENNEDETDSGAIENNEDTTGTGVMESNENQTDIGAVENNKNTTGTEDIESNKDTAETEVENSETERDASLVTSFSNLAVSDPTFLVRNQEMKIEDRLVSSVNADQKLLMVIDEEKSMVQEGDNESVHGLNNSLEDHDLRRIGENEQEFQIRSDSSQATNQPSIQRFDSSTSHSEVYRGGDGGVNVFPGGQLNVKTLSVNPSPQSGLYPGVTLPSSTVFEGDGVIIYTEDDYEIAIDFKKHLENDFPTLKIEVDLFNYIDMNMSLYASLESVLYKYRYVFIIITENLNKDKVKARANEDLLYDSCEEEWKSGRIVPVWPFEDGTKHCRMLFKSLKGIQFYKSKFTGQKKKFYEEGVETFINRVRENSVKWEAFIKENKGKGIQS